MREVLVSLSCDAAMVREPLELEKLTKRQLLQIIYDAYQAVGALADRCDIFDHPDVVRLLDVLAYGRSVMDEHELLPWPRQPEGLPPHHADRVVGGNA